DASSAWSMDSKWQRVLVGAGGMIFELFVAAICAFVWKYSNPDTLVHALAYNTMFIASVSTLLFNANPLLRYDGYYILSDLLEIPNLRQKSMEYSLGLIKRHVFRVKSPIPLPPPGQLIGLIPFKMTFDAQGFVEPEQKQTMRARTSGFVDQIAVKDGQRVRAGQVLVQCSDKDLDTQIAKLEAEIRGIDAQVKQGVVLSQSERLYYENMKTGRQKELNIMTRQRDDLTIKAPFDGLVVAPLIHELQGKFVSKGD